jgi:uncharacterized protein (TIGR02996 family)
MVQEDELIADLTELIEELVADGSLELATRLGAGALAAPLSASIEQTPDLDLEAWFLDREEVTELYADNAALHERLAPILLRLERDNPEPRWNDALAAAILAAPDDLNARLVFGDWLHQEGDPRGELIAVQARLESHPKDVEALRHCESTLLKRFEHTSTATVARGPP